MEKEHRKKMQEMLLSTKATAQDSYKMLQSLSMVAMDYKYFIDTGDIEHVENHPNLKDSKEIYIQYQKTLKLIFNCEKEIKAIEFFLEKYK